MISRGKVIGGFSEKADRRDTESKYPDSQNPDDICGSRISGKKQQRRMKNEKEEQ